MICGDEIDHQMITGIASSLETVFFGQSHLGIWLVVLVLGTVEVKCTWRFYISCNQFFCPRKNKLAEVVCFFLR